MKLLLAGSRQRFVLLHDALNGNVCDIKEIKDGGQLMQESGRVGENYDWVILDGRVLKGEMDFARLLDEGGFSVVGGERVSKVGVSGNGLASMKCRMQARSGGAYNVSHACIDPSDTKGRFLFEYHAPCRKR